MPPKKNSNLSGFSIHNHVELVRGGADYFDRIEKIADNAISSLHLQTYIFDEDETGSRVADALIRAAKRKVHVYVLLDGYASRKLSSQFISGLKDAGVHFSFFKPVFKSDVFYLGRRLHHKVIVADVNVCMVAGINISNRYNDVGETKAWLDWAVYVEGETAKQLNNTCVNIWNRSAFRERCVAPKIQAPVQQQECAVRIRRNDWVYKKTEITRSYRELFHHAVSFVTVMTGYFWPPQRLLKRMAQASKRGVKIKLILTAKADVPLSKYTERYLYDWLFRNNIEIYEYEKNILHGKIAVRDNEWITAGSYNMNNISAFASVELNLEIKNTMLATEVNDKLQSIIVNDCRRVNKEDFHSHNNLAKQFFYFMSYKITHIIFFLFTFYFRQRKWNDN